MKIKSLLLVAVLALGFTAANAQIQLGATLGAGIPTGDFGDGCKTGFGLTVNGKYLINDNLAIGAEFGYNKFSYKEGSEGLVVIPFGAIGEYNFGDMNGIKPLVGLFLGMYNAKSTASGAESKTNLGFAPYVGATYELSDVLDLTANLRYNYIMDAFEKPSSIDFTTGNVTYEKTAATYLGLNVGIIYKLK